jgi:outer membrane protease
MASFSEHKKPEHPSANLVQDSSHDAVQRVPIQDLQEGETRHHLSWNELGQQVEQQDWLIEGTLTLKADVSIERLHRYTRDKQGNKRFTLGNGWLVSLVFSPPASQEQQPFPDGVSFMIADLRYASRTAGPVHLADTVRALGIDPDAHIWKVQLAP